MCTRVNKCTCVTASYDQVLWRGKNSQGILLISSLILNEKTPKILFSCTDWEIHYYQPFCLYLWMYVANIFKKLFITFSEFLHLFLAEGSDKTGSVRPSVLPSVLLSRHFLGIVSLVFSEIWHGARNSYEVVHDRAGFYPLAVARSTPWNTVCPSLPPDIFLGVFLELNH